MEWLELLKPVIVIAVTYGIGLIMNKPGYLKGKNVIATVSKAFADDKITVEEFDELKALFDKQAPPE